MTPTALVGHVWQARAHHSLSDGHGVRRQGDALYGVQSHKLMPCESRKVHGENPRAHPWVD